LREGNITAQVALNLRNFQGLIDTLRVPTLHTHTDDLEEDTIVRKLISLAAAAALLASTTASIAADTQSSSQPLAPGGAAGIHNAQAEWLPGPWWIGLGIVGLGVGTAIVLSNNNGHGGNHSATNTTP
jgi:hypothetical protein